MAAPRVFVSSTYYDLKHIRASLENFIEQLGYEAILSEKGDIAFSPDRALDESCYREVRNADIFVLIIGGRYGSEKSEGRPKRTREFFELYDSVTKQEFKSAVDQDIPIYIFVERGVYAEYQTYLRNKDNQKISYAHVDSANIFRLIDELLGMSRNNPVHQFDRYQEIEEWLKKQWAGTFRDFLKSRSSQKQLASLSAQVTELGEINKTLKTYLEQVVRKIDPKESEKLIESESERLELARQIEFLKHNGLAETIHQACDIPFDVIAQSIIRAESLSHLIDLLRSECVGPSGFLDALDSELDLRQRGQDDFITIKAWVEKQERLLVKKDGRRN
jgi:hypothetical protein